MNRFEPEYTNFFEIIEEPAVEVVEEPRGILLDGDTLGDWGNDTRIVEPGEIVEDNDEDPKDPEAVTDPEPIVVTPIKVEAEVVTIPDPGTYTPADYSFEVTVYDAEGKNGRPQKITSVDQWEELLEKEPNLGSTLSAERAMRKASKMETGLERDQADFDSRKKAFTDANQASQDNAAAQQLMVNELAYLTERGDIPAVEAKYANADWTDPEVAKQPGVKEQLELMDYLVKESARRVKAGLPKLTSFLDAHTAMQLQQRKTASVSAKDRAGEERKRAGSRVASPSPQPVNVSPKGIAVGRGGSLRDLNRDTNWEV